MTRSIGPIGFALALAGCGGDATLVGEDASRPEPSPLSFRTYVIAAVRAEVGDVAHPEEAYGVDLDGMIGGPPTSCTGEPDYVSPITGATGVDNQLNGILGTLDGIVGGDGFDGLVRDRILAGEYAVVLRLIGIDSYTNDLSVQVEVTLAELPVAAACRARLDATTCGADVADACAWSSTGTCITEVHPAASASCAALADRASCEADQYDGCSWVGERATCVGLAEAQTWTAVAGTPTHRAVGRITNGRLELVIDSLPFFIAARPSEIHPLLLSRVAITGRISADRIERAELGGSASAADVLAAAETLGFGDIDLPSFISADLDPLASDPTTCASYSVGFAFMAIPATLE